MSFLRARQRTFTALFPHPGNRTHLIPSRAAIAPVVIATVAQPAEFRFTFDRDVTTVTLKGWFYLLNAGPETVTNVTQLTSRSVRVQFSPAGVSTDTLEVGMDKDGELTGLLSARKVEPFSDTVVLP